MDVESVVRIEIAEIVHRLDALLDSDFGQVRFARDYLQSIRDKKAQEVVEIGGDVPTWIDAFIQDLRDAEHNLGPASPDGLGENG